MSVVEAILHDGFHHEHLETEDAVLKIFARLLVILLLSSTAVAAAAMPANASPQFLTCTGTDHVTYSPPLTNTVQTTQLSVTAVLDNCMYQEIPEPINSGSYGGTFDREASCNEITGVTGPPESRVRVINWDGGHYSELTYTAVTQRLVSTTLVTHTGTITAGQLTGWAVVVLLTATNPSPLDCIGAGVSTLDFSDAVTITPVG